MDIFIYYYRLIGFAGITSAVQETAMTN